MTLANTRLKKIKVWSVFAPDGEGNQKIFHPEAAFWDIDFNLFINKQKNREKNLWLSPSSLPKRIRQKNLLYDGSFGLITLKNLHFSFSQETSSLLARYPLCPDVWVA